MPRSLRKLTILQLFVLAIAAPSHAALPHQWSNSAKEAVGTAYGRASSKVWFTVGQGIVNEVYYPRIDRPQVGDSQLLFVNEAAHVFLEEKKDFAHQITHPPGIPRPLVRSHSRESIAGKQIEFMKEVLTDPQYPVLRVRYRFLSLPTGTKIYVLHKPAAESDGASDLGRVLHTQGSASAMIAWDKNAEYSAYQAVVTDARFESASIGVVGETDGWQDLSTHGKITYEIPYNGPANIALTAEIAPKQTQRPEFEILIGFGNSPEEALNNARASLKTPAKDVRENFDNGWLSYHEKLAEAPWLEKLDPQIRKDVLWNASVVKAHEDKSNPGAIIASLSIPNIPAGVGPSDRQPNGEYQGGYHLVWTRDLFKSALALLRLGDKGTALNALRFMRRMEHNGRISQNSWVDGRPFWTGHQMDQEAYPILLAYELKHIGVDLDDELKAFINRRIALLQKSDGNTDQERWEEAPGFSPNTLAVMSAALSRVGDQENAKRILKVALEKSVSRHGPLSELPYFIRISQKGNPDAGDTIKIANEGPTLEEYRVLDGGFLEWIRWFPKPDKYFGEAGIELAKVIRNTLTLYDNPRNGVAVANSELPLFRRYTADAYGVDHRGGPWPILSLERALPELKNGEKFLKYVKKLIGPGDLCSEQLDRNLKPMPFAASPLVWCHAELVELAYKVSSLR